MKKNKNTLLISREVLNMAKIEMKRSAKLLFYTVLREKFCDMKKRGADMELDIENDVALQDEIDIPVTITYKHLKKIIKGNRSFEDMLIAVEEINKQFTLRDSKNRIAGWVYMFERADVNHEDKTIDFTLTKSAARYYKCENFGKIELNEMYKIKTIYGIRLYEFICAHYNKSSNEHMAMKINEFRKYFNIPKDYKQGNIDQKMLKPALREINNNTRFKVEYKKLKNGTNKRVVTHIYLDIKETA